jgi:hypothetical protein
VAATAQIKPLTTEDKPTIASGLAEMREALKETRGERISGLEDIFFLKVFTHGT